MVAPGPVPWGNRVVVLGAEDTARCRGDANSPEPVSLRRAAWESQKRSGGPGPSRSEELRGLDTGGKGPEMRT